MADTSISPVAGQLTLTSKRPLILTDRVTNARSGVARSGVTRSGDTGASLSDISHFFECEIAEVNRMSALDLGELSISLQLGNSPSTLSAVVVPRGTFEVTRGQEIKVYDGGVDTGIPLFSGTVMQVSHSYRRTVDDPVYAIEAVDYRWLLDRFARVTRIYYNQDRRTILKHIVDNFTDANSGFSTGYVQAGLGEIDRIEFADELVSAAVNRLAESVDGGAYWTLDFKKRLSIFTSPDDEGNAITLTDGTTFRDFSHMIDLTQIATRIQHVGGGSATTATVAKGATTIPVEECGWYDPDGGDVLVGHDTISYTGISVGSGPGNLTGVTGVDEDIAAGENVDNVTVVNDTAAQTDLAGILGSSQSGVAIFVVRDGRLGFDETTQRANRFLDQLKNPDESLVYSVDEDTHVRPSRALTASLTAPVAVAGTFRIQQVNLTVRTKIEGSTIGMNREIHASLVRRSLTELLKQLD